MSSSGTLTTYKETANATIMLRWLNEISVRGGGDCPEYSMTGLVKGIHCIRKFKKISHASGLVFKSNI